MKRTQPICVYGFTGFNHTPKKYIVNIQNYKITSGKGYGFRGEYDDRTVIENKNYASFEAIILDGAFKYAKTWNELSLLSSIHYGI